MTKVVEGTGKHNRMIGFEMVEEAEDKYGGSNQWNKPKPETAKQWGDKAKKSKSKTRSGVVKGLGEESDPVKAKHTRR